LPNVAVSESALEKMKGPTVCSRAAVVGYNFFVDRMRHSEGSLPMNLNETGSFLVSSADVMKP